ncbi:MAG: RidA family protein [Nitrosopumilus sp.]
MITIEEKIKALGIILPPAPKPAGSYVPLVQINDLVYLSGQIPIDTNAEYPFVKYKGKIGQDTTIENGQQAALLCTLNSISLIKNHLKSLDRIKKVVKVSAYINCVSTFSEHPKVINPASELIVNIFGDKGNHTRIALGVGSLPLESVVEIEYLFQVN